MMMVTVTQSPSKASSRNCCIRHSGYLVELVDSLGIAKGILVRLLKWFDRMPPAHLSDVANADSLPAFSSEWPTVLNFPTLYCDTCLRTACFVCFSGPREFELQAIRPQPFQIRLNSDLKSLSVRGGCSLTIIRYVASTFQLMSLHTPWRHVRTILEMV